MTAAQRLAVAIAAELEAVPARDLAYHLADLVRRDTIPRSNPGPWDGRGLRLLAEAGEELLHLLGGVP